MTEQPRWTPHLNTTWRQELGRSLRLEESDKVSSKISALVKRHLLWISKTGYPAHTVAPDIRLLVLWPLTKYYIRKKVRLFYFLCSKSLTSIVFPSTGSPLSWVARAVEKNSTPFNLCCGSGSVGSVCFWASRIRILPLTRNLEKHWCLLFCDFFMTFYLLRLMQMYLQKVISKKIIFCWHRGCHWRKEQDTNPEPDPDP
jgi:hypothetical protein